MGTRRTLVSVADLHVQCSLRVRNFEQPGFAMSDCCGKPAVSAVEDAQGRKLWRCLAHQGILVLQHGPIHQLVEVTVDCPDVEDGE